jgi:Tfp pilus assembly protein PilO
MNEELQQAFEAMMRDTFGDAVSLKHDGIVYTDGFVGAVHIGWMKGALAEAERFKRELELRSAQAQAGEGEEKIQRLRGQLQNCVNHIERLKRHHPRETEKLEACVQSANKCLYETLHDTRPQPQVNQNLLEAIKVAIECLGQHGDGFVDLGAMTVLQDFLAAIAAAQEGK